MFCSISDTTFTKQTSRMGEQPSLQQAGAPLATYETALRLFFHDGIRPPHRVYAQNTHLQTRLGRTYPRNQNYKL